MTEEEKLLNTTCWCGHSTNIHQSVYHDYSGYSDEEECRGKVEDKIWLPQFAGKFLGLKYQYDKLGRCTCSYFSPIKTKEDIFKDRLRAWAIELWDAEEYNNAIKLQKILYEWDGKL